MGVKEERIKQNLTQTKLAEAVEVDRSTVGKWENGVALPRAKTLVKLAKALGCTTDALLTK